MNNYARSINRHYGEVGLFEKICALLAKDGKDIEALKNDDLTAFDELHIGGRGETRNLAKLASVGEGKEVLDVGSGIGGPARTLAGEFGAQVVGLDITEEFCRTARELTQRVGLGEKITFHHGSALEMPFEDTSFDIVWTQFAAMNIHDRSALYCEMFRVLRPGGTLAIHEVMGARDTALKFPVLWAQDSSISFIKPAVWVREELARLGLREKLWNDMTEFSIRWFEKKKTFSENDEYAQASKALFGTENLAERVGNVLFNLREGRIVVIQTIWEKPSHEQLS